MTTPGIGDPNDSNIKIAVGDRFETKANEDTILSLNTLCAPCTSFVQKSTILQSLGRKDVKIGAKEEGHVGSPAQIKEGYESGSCHLCALLWARAGGYLLDPANPIRPDIDQNAPVKVNLLARDVEKEYEIEVEGHQDKAKKYWRKIASMPPITDVGFVQLRIEPLRQDVYADLHIHHSSNPKLNHEVINVSTCSVSSRSEANYESIKSWVKHCDEHHPKCIEFQGLVAPASQLPSRLLDVSNGKIRLECGVEGLPAGFTYTTLSHMWGPDPSACPQLERHNLESFAADIPISKLPGKYADAILITRALGFRYIWIDSLCIVQDWPEDWTREALKMASVYGRSSLNISYTFPPADEATRKYLRDPRLHLPCRVPYAKNKNQQTDALVIQHRPGSLRPSWSPTVYKRIWPLLSRGWVFQERLLCNRTVYYGQDRLLWECCSAITDEFYGPLTTVPGSKTHFHRIITGIATSLSSIPASDSPTNPAPVPTTTTGGGLTINTTTDTTTAQSQWGPLVRDYRSGDLTKEFDRGIAFAGIARAVITASSVAGGNITYLAGLWKELFAYDLLWSVNPTRINTEKYLAQKNATNAAPSWSWFSIPTLQTELGSDILDFPFRTTMQIYPRWTVFEAKVANYHHPKGGEVMLHDFGGMSVTLVTKKIPAGWDWWSGMPYALPRGEEKWVLGSRENRVGTEMVRPRVLKYAHDDLLLEVGGGLPPDAQIVLAVEQLWHTDLRTPEKFQFKVERGVEREGCKTSYQWAGIAVVPAEVGWKRVGAVIFSDDFYEAGWESPWDEVEVEEVVLV